MRVQTLFLALLTNLGGRDALVITVIPFRDAICYGDTGVGSGWTRGLFSGGGLGLPREGIVAADVEELEGTLGAVPRRDVAAGARLVGRVSMEEVMGYM
jgi:hypothetical protein